MGYYTGYSLDLRGNVENHDEIIADLRNSNENADWAIDENGEQQESCKWYEHEVELKAFSKKYPEVIFCLHGTGEEPGDVWDKYFLNGKWQYCKAKIVIPPFDPTKLQ